MSILKHGILVEVRLAVELRVAWAVGQSTQDSEHPSLVPCLPEPIYRLPLKGAQQWATNRVQIHSALEAV